MTLFPLAALSDGQVSLFGENSVIGRTMVLHKGVDDLGKGDYRR